MVPPALRPQLLSDRSRSDRRKLVLFGQLEIGGIYCQRNPRFRVSRRLTVQSSCT